MHILAQLSIAGYPLYDGNSSFIFLSSQLINNVYFYASEKAQSEQEHERKSFFLCVCLVRISCLCAQRTPVVKFVLVFSIMLRQVIVGQHMFVVFLEALQHPEALATSCQIKLVERMAQ